MKRRKEKSSRKHDMPKIKPKNNFKRKRWTFSLEEAEEVFLMGDFDIRVARKRPDGISERLE